MLKADFHIHTSEDPYDQEPAYYSVKSLIDLAAKQGFDVLAFTFHSTYYRDSSMVEYARKKGILLIPGVELKLSGRHFLVINPDPDSLLGVKTISDLRRIKNSRNLIIAAHPFVTLDHGVERFYAENLDSFDAIEYCHFYFWGFNPNKKGIAFSKKHKKPMFGSSDTHLEYQFGTTYTLIDSKKDVNSIITAVKAGRVSVVSSRLSFWTFLKIVWIFGVSNIKTMIFNRQILKEHYSIIKK